MTQRYWTEDRIEVAKRYLRAAPTINAALDRMRKTPAFADVTLASLRHGFERHAQEGPGKFVGLGAPDEPMPPTVAERAAAPGEGHTIIVPDLHAPYHDRQAWDVCLAAIAEIKPHRVVTIGDTWDFYAVSSFDKDPSRAARLVDELGTVRPEMKRFRRTVADAELLVCQGNHEHRLDKYLAKRAGALHGLEGLSAREIMLRDLKGAKWVRYRSHEKIGHVLYTHDIGFSGIYAGRHSLVAAGTNIVFGHTHRGGVVIDGDHLGDRRFSLNVGWLGDLTQIDYMYEVKTRDWATGFGYIYTDAETGMVWPSFVPILAGRCRVAGRTVRA